MNLNIKLINDVFIRFSQASNSKADIWCIHGFGESGLSFKEIFSSPLAKRFNIYVFDLPGFGVSPYNSKSCSIKQSVKLLGEIIKKISEKRKIIILAHSLGGIIGSLVCKTLKKQINCYLNVEGSLTTSDANCYFHEAAKAKSPNMFFSKRTKALIKEAKNNIGVQRYFASFSLADPRALVAWGKSAYKVTGICKSGKDFVNLDIKKIYFWGRKSITDETLRFIKGKSIPNYEFKNCGHWPADDNPNLFYRKVLEFIVNS